MTPADTLCSSARLPSSDGLALLTGRVDSSGSTSSPAGPNQPGDIRYPGKQAVDYTEDDADLGSTMWAMATVIYLDQNHWIELIRRRRVHGQHEQPARRIVTLDDPLTPLYMLVHGVGNKTCRLPLSGVHYKETSRRTEPASRFELGEFMHQMSRRISIRHSTDVIREEIAAAVTHVFHGAPRESIDPWGIGWRDALPGLPGWNITVPPGMTTAQVNTQADVMFERGVLTGDTGLPSVPSMLQMYPENIRQHAEKYAEGQNEIREKWRSENWLTGERSERLFAARSIADLLDPLQDAMIAQGIPPDQFLELGKDGMTEFIALCPAWWTLTELERLKHQADQKPWEANDLDDLAALCVAIPYCDVVVTEKKWTALALRAQLDARYHTEILHRLDDLPVRLAAPPIPA